MCIDYAFRPRLSSRLTRSGRTFLLKPKSFGHYDSHIIRATHSGILTCMQSTAAFAATSPRIQRSPTICSCSSQLRFFLKKFTAASRQEFLLSIKTFRFRFCLKEIYCRFASGISSFLYQNHEEQLHIPSFGVRFSPVKFSAQSHSTSELLRTLLMSGCF